MAQVAIRITGLASGGSCPQAGSWVRSFNPEAYDGRGNLVTTRKPAQALLFSDGHKAWEFWMTVPKARPVRPDGRPNRPLTAFSIEVGPIERGASRPN